MPTTRESTIDPMNTVAQLLSYLQIEGHLDGVEVPDWATGGTSVEELMLALRKVRDGEWLQPFYPRHGPAEAADKWIADFLSGKDVASPGDRPKIGAVSRTDLADSSEPKKRWWSRS
jgi:hypothetical protein